MGEARQQQKLGGGQRLSAEYAKQFGVKAPDSPLGGSIL